MDKHDNAVEIYKMFQPEVNKLFTEYKDLPLVNQGYELREIIDRNCILFISANPSGTNKKEWNESYNIYTKKNSFFKKMTHFSEKYNLPWGEIDLICLVEKTLNNVKDNYYKNNIPQRNKEFIVKLMDITKRMIAEIQPKFIVVASAFASEHIKELYNETENGLGYAISDEKTGLKQTPVEYTGMFSGQGQVTRYDYDRLCKVIDFRLKELNII